MSQGGVIHTRTCACTHIGKGKMHACHPQSHSYGIIYQTKKELGGKTLLMRKLTDSTYRLPVIEQGRAGVCQNKHRQSKTKQANTVMRTGGKKRLH